MTASGKEPPEPRNPKPRVPQPRPSEEDLAELWEPPDDLPVPEYPDRWLPGRPEYVIVENQPRGPASQPIPRRGAGVPLARTRDPEPDLEADYDRTRTTRRLTDQRAQTAAQDIVAALALPLSPTSAEPRRPLPLIGLHQLSRDTTMLYGVGPVDASGRVKNGDIVRALGWQPGDKLEVVPGLGGIVIFSSPDGLFTVPVKPCIVIPAAARRIHDIQPGDHVLLAAAPEYSVVIVHTRQAVNEMLARYHSAFPPRGHQHEQQP